MSQRLHPYARFFSQLREVVERQHSFHLHVIGLLDMFPVPEQFGGEIAIVGEQDDAGRRVLEIADRIDARGKAAQGISQRLAAFWIGHRSDDFGRFVKRQVNQLLGRGDDFPGGFDTVGCEVGFRAELGHHAPVHTHLPARNELLSVAPGSNSRPRNNLLQSFLHFVRFSV